MLLQTLEQFLLVLLSGEDDDEAYDVLRQIYSEVRLAYDEGSFYYLTSALGMGNWLQQEGREEEAEPYFREALEHMTADPDSHQLYRRIAIDRLFQIVRKRSDPESVAESDALLEQVIEHFRDSWSPTELVTNLDYLADRLGSRELYARALEPATRAVRVARDGLDERAASRLSNELVEIVLKIAITRELDDEVYERGLQATEEILEFRPDDSAFVVARGAILHRLDRSQEAYELYTGIETAANPRYDMVAPVKLAFHALMTHRLGEADSASVYFAQLIESESGSHKLDKETLRTLIAEVRDTLDRHE